MLCCYSLSYALADIIDLLHTYKLYIELSVFFFTQVEANDEFSVPVANLVTRQVNVVDLLDNFQQWVNSNAPSLNSVPDHFMLLSA